MKLTGKIEIEIDVSDSNNKHCGNNCPYMHSLFHMCTLDNTALECANNNFKKPFLRSEQCLKLFK